jgi:hypothetical protein
MAANCRRIEEVGRMGGGDGDVVEADGVNDGRRSKTVDDRVQSIG